MAAPTAIPIVTKLSQETLHITCSKVLLPHLRFEAEIEVQIEVQSSISYITQAIDGHAIGIGQALGNSCAVPVFVSRYLWQEEGREEGQ